jgi:hypothetical protein
MHRVEHHDSLATLAHWPSPEVFFLTALRCRLSGYETSDVSCWELAWQGALRTLAVPEAKRTMAELAYFTRMLRATLRQRFIYLPYCCSRLTETEQLTVLLVGATQRGEMDTAAGLARTITGNDEHAELVAAARDLSVALLEAGLQFTLNGASTVGGATRSIH